jgi:ABC-type nitrate/sulfonate/bicarbonate transport system ATPase subunit
VGWTSIVGRSEMVAVVGRSGASKTPLLNVISGLDTGYQGSVEVADSASPRSTGS